MASGTDSEGSPESGAIVITGAGGGIGKELVLAILEAGFPVFATDVSPAAIQALVDAVPERRKPMFDYACFNLTEDGVEHALLSACVQRFGSIFGLINNAGVARSSFWRNRATDGPRFWEVEPEIWRRFFAINAEAPFRLASVFARHMIERGKGRIINVTTSLESMLNAQMAPYGPSKAATEALSAIMANDLAGTGVTVNVVIPGGPTDTQMVAVKASVPRSSLLPPSVMVPPVLWLLSGEASEISGKRFVAWKWDATSWSAASAPVAWSSIASGSMRRPAQ
jgi:NAD(P)-dependent dehydrogenase (short-subunit alcohol dehydrogenase family)